MKLFRVWKKIAMSFIVTEIGWNGFSSWLIRVSKERFDWLEFQPGWSFLLYSKSNHNTPIFEKLIGATDLRIALIKMFIPSTLFVWHLSRRIVRSKSEVKWAATYRKTPRRDWLKKTNDRASLVHNLKAVHEFFLSAEGGVKSFDKSGSKSRKMEKRALSTRIENLLSSYHWTQVGFCERRSPMAESDARDWVLVWVEELHRPAGSKRLWKNSKNG